MMFVIKKFLELYQSSGGTNSINNESSTKFTKEFLIVHSLIPPTQSSQRFPLPFSSKEGQNQLPQKESQLQNLQI